MSVLDKQSRKIFRQQCRKRNDRLKRKFFIKTYCPVEPHTTDIINQLIEQAGAVFFLTSRSLSSKHRSFTQLERLGINPLKSSVTLKNGLRRIEHLKPFSVHNNVISTEHSPKGPVAKAIIEELSFHPQSITLIDNLYKNIESFRVSFENSVFNLNLFHYTAYQTIPHYQDLTVATQSKILIHHGYLLVDHIVNYHIEKIILQNQGNALKEALKPEEGCEKLEQLFRLAHSFSKQTLR